MLYHLRRHPEFESEIAERKQALAHGVRNAEQLRPLCSTATLDLIASFQNAVVNNLVSRSLSAAEQFGAKSVLVSGGVAANRQLRRNFEEEAQKRRLEVFFPSRQLSTDNAAMIAAAAYPRFVARDFADGSLNAEPNLPLA
jgi:N6-L-threonylcarbamoyladenine synthase